MRVKNKKDMKSLKVAALALLATATVRAQDLKKEEVPSDLMSNFEKEYANATDVEWEKEDELYKVEFDMDRNEYELWYDASGKMTKMEKELKVAELPQAIKSKISSSYASYKIDDIEIKEENEKTTYEVELEDGRKEITVIFDESGSVIKEFED